MSDKHYYDSRAAYERDIAKLVLVNLLHKKYPAEEVDEEIDSYSSLLPNMEDPTDPYVISGHRIETHGSKVMKASRFLKKWGVLESAWKEDGGRSNRYPYDKIPDKVFYRVSSKWIESLKESAEEVVPFAVLDNDSKLVQDDVEYESPLHASYRYTENLSYEELKSLYFYPENYDIIDRPYMHLRHVRGTYGVSEEKLGIRNYKAFFPKSQIEQGEWKAFIHKCYDYVFENQENLITSLVATNTLKRQEAYVLVKRGIDGFSSLYPEHNNDDSHTDSLTRMIELLDHRKEQIEFHIHLMNKMGTLFGNKGVAIAPQVAYCVTKSILMGLSPLPITVEEENESFWMKSDRDSQEAFNTLIEAAKDLSGWDEAKNQATLLMTDENEDIKQFVNKVLEGY